MLVNILKSKIHRAIVTKANLAYIGSITIDEDLMDAANIFENEQVHVLNINNGERFITYVFKGKRGSGEIIINGAASRLVQINDVVIIVSYAVIDLNEVKTFSPIIIFPDKNKLLYQPPFSC
jgi:aspartate 1-decarboxylase